MLGSQLFSLYYTIWVLEFLVWNKNPIFCTNWFPKIKWVVLTKLQTKAYTQSGRVCRINNYAGTYRETTKETGIENWQIKTNFGYPVWKVHNQNHVNPGLITLCDCRITYLFCGCLCLLLSLWRSMFPAIVGNIAGADNKIGLNFVPAYFQSLTQWYEHTFVICRKSCL